MKKYNIEDTKLYNDICKTAYILNKEELVKASKVMASAFDDDPSIRYLLGGTKEGIYDWKYFLCVLKAIYGKCVILSLDENINFTYTFSTAIKSSTNNTIYVKWWLKII